MWRSYLAVAFRSLLRNRVYAFVNIMGLALGIAAATLVFIYVRMESSYDRWLPDAGRIVQLQSILNPTDGPVARSATAPRVAVDALRREFPEFEQVVGVMRARTAIVFEGEPRRSLVYWADSNFFEVFDLPFLRGDPRSALRDLNSVVLTQEEATRYFGTSDPIGRTIMVNRYGEDQPLRVTGVIADLPPNTHLELGMIARFNPAIEIDYGLTDWGARNGFVYGKLRPGVAVDAVNRRMPAFERRNLTAEQAEPGRSIDQLFDFRFMPIRDIHLSPGIEDRMLPGGDPVAVKAFSVVALLILAIACINFTNLTTARASLRAREVGIRKVLGATRGRIAVQFLGEAIMLAAIAGVIGLALVELALPFYSRLLGLELGLSYLGGDGLLLPALLLVLVVGVVGGLYPAFYLARFHPANVLRASARAGVSGAGRLRTILVVGQFSIAIGLIVCASIVYAQTVYARSLDPGFERSGLLVMGNIHPGVAASRDSLQREMERVPGVRSVSFAGIAPGDEQTAMASLQRPGASGGAEIDLVPVDYGFLETMRIRLLAGRTLSRAFARDDSSVDFDPSTPDERQLVARGMNAVLNEAAARRLGFADPQAALGQEIRGDLIGEGTIPVTIVGIASDARFGSLRDEVRPVLYQRFAMRLGRMFVRFDGASPLRVRRDAERVWRRVLPEVPLEASFVEDDLSRLYQEDEVRGQVFALASALAVAIACLGLFGLAAFTVEQRRLEIAIRKVFGAGSGDIVGLMAWQFGRPVLAANLIAWPVAWWLMRDWLNGFEARIELGPTPFLLGGLLALLVAVVTVAGYAFKAARANPIHALRYE